MVALFAVTVRGALAMVIENSWLPVLGEPLLVLPVSVAVMVKL
jgi:hypothetical protein